MTHDAKWYEQKIHDMLNGFKGRLREIEKRMDRLETMRPELDDITSRAPSPVPTQRRSRQLLSEVWKHTEGSPERLEAQKAYFEALDSERSSEMALGEPTE